MTTGTIPPNTLAMLRGWAAEAKALQAAIDQAITVLLEAHGYDPNAVVLDRLDLDLGTYTLSLKEAGAGAPEVTG